MQDSLREFTTLEKESNRVDRKSMELPVSSHGVGPLA